MAVPNHQEPLIELYLLAVTCVSAAATIVVLITCAAKLTFTPHCTTGFRWLLVTLLSILFVSFVQLHYVYPLCITTESLSIYSDLKANIHYKQVTCAFNKVRKVKHCTVS
jgi:hypothetical protein